ncbi:glycosyltransferase [Pedobacter sp. AW31-3R]|uniref:glycosyltransferase n=1 Tax=Pedobacter sp. AW31-3R TaxID=3445781 RepID=UPI003F9F94C1
MEDKKKTELRLLQTGDNDYFLDCVDEFYSAIEFANNGFKVRRVMNTYGQLKSYLVRLLTMLPFIPSLKPMQVARDGNINFAAMISGDFRLMIPSAFLSPNNYIYMYDAWPRFHHWIFPLLDFFNVRWVFFSSKQVHEDYIRKFPKNRCKSMWLPEALTIAEYQWKEHHQRTIDVLEFGRNYAAYHDLIVEPLKSYSKNHVYKTPDRKVLFPGKASFTAALSDSRIVICIPSDISHPERAEYISTMTLRYLQAMASKCLIVGFLPSDMEEIFGYVPIVQIDMSNAAKQILAVLDHYNDYLPLIERNYERVKSEHQWLNRWKIIKEVMEESRI